VRHGAVPRQAPRTDGPRNFLVILRLAWRSDRWHTVQALACAIASAANPAVQVALTARMTRAFLAAANKTAGLSGILLCLSLMAVSGLAAQLLAMVQNRAAQRCQSRLSAHLSSRIVARAVRLTLVQAEDHDVHDALQRATREVDFRPGLLFQQMLQTTAQLVGFTTIGAVLFSLDYRVALLAMVAPLPTLASQILSGRRSYALERSRSADRRRLMYWQQLASQLESIKEILAFRLGPLVVEQHSALLARVVNADLRLANRNFRLGIPLAVAAAALAFAAQVTAVAISVGSAGITMVFAVVQAIVLLQSSIQQLLSTVSNMYVNQLYMGNVMDFLALPERGSDSGSVPFPTEIKHGIELRGVSFTYPGSERLVLCDVSVTLRPGETTAIVGQNGAGKSTLSKLLGRLYEPTAGEILVDGRPLREFTIESLRDRVGYVFQDYVRYQLTVADNIEFGTVSDPASPRTMPATRRAAESAGIAEHVESLPLGYQTQLGKAFDGVDLSGGQWQRLAVARGLIRSASVRVMDEPTAAIDVIAEESLLDALTETAPQRVNVLIGHRFSSVCRADRILVLADGRLVEDGSHDELIRAGGLYADMYSTYAVGREPIER
jgi:ATP-binding cassette subfamily B protein